MDIKLAARRLWVSLSLLQISTLIEGDQPCHARQKNSFLWSLFRHNGQLAGTHKGFLISLDRVCHCQTYILSFWSFVPNLSFAIDEFIDRFYRLINVCPDQMTNGNDINHWPVLILTTLFRKKNEEIIDNNE